MKTMLRNAVSLLLCWNVLLVGCGGGSSSKDPAPLVITDKPPTTAPTTETAPPEAPTTLTDNFEPIPNVPVMGSINTLEIGCWNIENYPKATGSKTMVSKVLKQMDVDVMSLEEINGQDAFNDLLKEMPNFTGEIALGGNNQVLGQNVGIIYKKAEFTLVKSEILFGRESYYFPRPPMLLRLKPRAAGRKEFVVIGVHLKAFGDEESQMRREKANEKLEQYVASLRASEPTLPVILLGDFNQPMLTLDERQAFNPWLQRADLYTVQTDALVAKGDYSYYSFSRQSLIDHVISTKDFGLSEPVIPKLHTLIPGYEVNASDHLPVITTVY